MLQIIFMIIGTVYFFRLIGLGQGPAKLGLDDPDLLARWRFHRRRQYLWMIAAGWGVAAASLLVSWTISQTVQLTQDSALTIQIVLVIACVVAMIVCAVFSSNAGGEADRIESGRAERNPNPERRAEPPLPQAMRNDASCANCGAAISGAADRCRQCAKPLCSDCRRKCAECTATLCADHAHRCGICDRLLCWTCLAMCGSCGRMCCGSHVDASGRCSACRERAGALPPAPPLEIPGMREIPRIERESSTSRRTYALLIFGFLGVAGVLLAGFWLTRSFLHRPVPQPPEQVAAAPPRAEIPTPSSTPAPTPAPTPTPAPPPPVPRPKAIARPRPPAPRPAAPKKQDSGGALIHQILDGVSKDNASVDEPAPQSVNVPGTVQVAKLIQKVTPVYPALAKQARITGVVRLAAVIGKDGTVESVRVVSGHPLLVNAAMDAVKQWVFRPTLLNGEPVQVRTEIAVSFTLSQ